MCITTTARRRHYRLPFPIDAVTSAALAPAPAPKETTASLGVVSSTCKKAQSYVPAKTQSYVTPKTQSYVPSKTQSYVPPKTQSYVPPKTQSYVPPKTASYEHQRQSVHHDYHDHSRDLISSSRPKAKGGVTTPFPVRLHEMLDQIEADGLSHVVSWQPHGRCFVVHKPKEFVDHVMPKYFKQTKLASFQRQLNLYGFNRLTAGPDKGGYYHEMFLRGKSFLGYRINRMRVKGTGVRMATSPDSEPNFYAMPPLGPVANAPPRKRVEVTAIPPANFVSHINHTVHRPKTMINKAPPRKQQDYDDDVVLFEGKPFHYLDPFDAPTSPDLVSAKPALEVPDMTLSTSQPIVPDGAISMKFKQHAHAPIPKKPAPKPSSPHPFVSDDEDEHKPLSEEEVKSFFATFEMPVDHYHDVMEAMGDDTAFGYLLEEAIQ